MFENEKMKRHKLRDAPIFHIVATELEVVALGK
jgi:hypothetical protein